MTLERQSYDYNHDVDVMKLTQPSPDKHDCLNFNFQTFCDEIDEIMPDIAKQLRELDGAKVVKGKDKRKAFIVTNEPNLKKYYVPLYNFALNSQKSLRLVIFGGFKFVEYGDISLDPQEITNILLLKDNCPQWKSSKDFENFLNCSDENELSVANMLIVNMHEKYFNLKHRFVHPLYRKKKGIGSAMLYAVESLFKERASLDKTPYSILATGGQKHVINLLKKYHYQPFKERDRKLLEKLESPNSDIVIGENLYYFPASIPPAKRTLENFRNGLRIQLLKILMP